MPSSATSSLTKFMNCLMYDGKKSVAERIVYGAFDAVEASQGRTRCACSTTRSSNVKPAVEVRSRRVGGATYQVPVEVRPERAPGAGDPLDHPGARATAPSTR